MTRAQQVLPPAHDPAPGWGESLGTGAAGIALLHIERARTGIAGWDIAHGWTSAVTRSPVTANPDIASLYRGAPAVAFTLHTAAQSAYTCALKTLDSHITTLIRHRLHRAHERIDRAQLPAAREFDLINGLTGIGAYLLHRHGDADQLRDVLAYLVRLTEPLQTAAETLPGWWCRNPPTDSPAHRWPGGHGDLGLAHGIAGPLTLLSTALRRGITVAGHAEAIGRILAWFDQLRCATGRRAWWPERISRSEWHTRTVAQHGPQRPSWCYGTPGLARAQQLAALALDDPRRQRQAEDALIGCVTDEHQLSKLSDATLCHGWAGLAHTTWRTAAAGPGSALTTCLPHLRARLDQHLDRHGTPVDDGLLEGRAGIRLVQHTTSIGEPSTVRWDACLLVGG